MKQVLITGGSRGIGKATVELFLKNGWRVAFTYHRSVDSAQELVQTGKGNCAAFFCDLSSSADVETLYDKVKQEFGTPDVLVNNAGISSYGLFQDMTSSELERLFRVNFLSAYELTAKVVPGMIRRGSGRIINLSSIWGEVGASCEVAYSASKAAVIGFTRALAKELAPSGIPVNAVSPGVVDTDMLSPFSEVEKKAICGDIPLGRFCSPEEIAQTILFLAQDAPISLTGQILGANGCYA